MPYLTYFVHHVKGCLLSGIVHHNSLSDVIHPNKFHVFIHCKNVKNVLSETCICHTKKARLEVYLLPLHVLGSSDTFIYVLNLSLVARLESSLWLIDGFAFE